MKEMKLTISTIDGQHYLRDNHYAGIYVDMAFDAISWSSAHGYDKAYQVKDDKGNMYDIWAKPDWTGIVAIPIKA